MADPALLELDDLRVTFGRGSRAVTVVDGVSWRLDPGRTVVVLGESGSGKSVSALAVAGLLPRTARTSGAIRYSGSELLGGSQRELRRYRAQGYGMVFQDPLSALNPTRRVGNQIAELLRVHRGMTRHAGLRAAESLLDRVHLPDAAEVARRYPHELSGGMRQRVVIAMAITLDPPLLIADEPTTALDVSVQASILRTMRELQVESGTALVLITHDIGVAAAMADEIVVMYAGRVMEHGPRDQVLNRPSHPYTKALLAATPRPNADRGRLEPIPGTPPDFASLPQGCRFNPRCAYRQDLCLHADPPEHTVEAVRSACHFAAEVHAGEAAATPTPVEVAG